MYREKTHRPHRSSEKRETFPNLNKLEHSYRFNADYKNIAIISPPFEKGRDPLFEQLEVPSISYMMLCLLI